MARCAYGCEITQIKQKELDRALAGSVVQIADPRRIRRRFPSQRPPLANAPGLTS